MNRTHFRALIAEASAPYRAAGRFAWHFARGKLAFDPVFPALLSLGLVPDQARILDLGCGQGLLLALLTAARDRFESGGWPADWPPPPGSIGIEGSRSWHATSIGREGRWARKGCF